MTVNKFENLIGRTISSIKGAVKGNVEIDIETEDGYGLRFYHFQDCCEDVRIEDIIGEVEDLIGSPILEAEQISEEIPPSEFYESMTWTFYRFSTAKGTVTIRWLGSSNGYYSEEVDFDEKVPPSKGDGK